MRILLPVLVLIILQFSAFGQKQADEPISYKDDFTLDWKKNNDTLILCARSNALAPIQLTFHSRKNAEELKSFRLMPYDSIDLIAYSGTNPDSVFQANFSDSVRVSYFFGHESLIKPDLNYQYRLPFKKNKKYEVSQGFNGSASHTSERSRFAIDFQLDVGEPVYAARGGIAIKVIDWFTRQGGEELINAANKIIILHDDGTMASYVHLEYKGSFVSEGQRVKAGDKIGISGLTGYTNGPHLHFVVRKENDISIPVFFKGYEKEFLKQGKKYKVK